MKNKQCGSLLIGLFFLISFTTYAAEPTAEQLNAISNSANGLCGNISTAGNNSEFKIGAEVNAQSKGLAKILGSLGGGGNVDYNSNAFANVLQSDLPNVLKNNEECKSHVFTDWLNTAFPQQVAVTANNVQGNVTVSDNDLEADKVAAVNGAGSLNVQRNKQRKKAELSPQKNPCSTTSSAAPDTEAPATSGPGFSMGNSTVLGDQSIIDANNFSGNISLTHTKQIKDEKSFFTFPTARGDLNELSNDALTRLTLDYATVLDEYGFETDRVLSEQLDAKRLTHNKVDFRKHYLAENDSFKSNYLPNALNIASEWMRRLQKNVIAHQPLSQGLGNIQKHEEESDVRSGAIILLDGKLSGPNPFHCVALFLRYLTTAQPSNNPPTSPYNTELSYPSK